MGLQRVRHDYPFGPRSQDVSAGSKKVETKWLITSLALTTSFNGVDLKVPCNTGTDSRKLRSSNIRVNRVRGRWAVTCVGRAGRWGKLEGKGMTGKGNKHAQGPCPLEHPKRSPTFHFDPGQRRAPPAPGVRGAEQQKGLSPAAVGPTRWCVCTYVCVGVHVCGHAGAAAAACHPTHFCPRVSRCHRAAGVVPGSPSAGEPVPEQRAPGSALCPGLEAHSQHAGE